MADLQKFNWWFRTCSMMALVACLGHVGGLFGQETTYETVLDIPYRTAEAEPEWDAYMAEKCVLDLYYPTNRADFPTVVWFHGGGLRGGKATIPAALKNQGLAVVAVSYRLHPTVAAPVYFEDSAAAVAWVFKNIAKYGGNTNSIYVTGHSAGGYITCMVGFDKEYLAQHDIDADAIAGLIPYSTRTVTHPTIRKERGFGPEQPIIDDMAPLYHIRNDCPPVVLISGDRELEKYGRYEENAYLARMLQQIGHQHIQLYELDGFNHGQMQHPAHAILLRFIQATEKAKKKTAVPE